MSVSCCIGGVPHSLSLFILYLELPLHLKIGLTLTLNALLLHVANDTSVHGLGMVNEPETNQAEGKGSIQLVRRFGPNARRQ